MQRDGRRLLGTLPHVDPASFFGRFGYALLGEAYNELQLEGPATDVYEKGLKQGIGGFLGDQMTFELAALHLQRGDIDKSQSLLNKLKAGPRKNWAVRSRLQLAEISYQAGKDDECLDACRQLLAETSNRVNKPSVLRIMGRVYERKGDHEKAAMCFGGLNPAESVAGGAAAEGKVN
jgi:tetratricopeptide (TPR) repeat protein